MRNQMGNQWMNDSLIVYLEKDIVNIIDNEYYSTFSKHGTSQRIIIDLLSSIAYDSL